MNGPIGIWRQNLKPLSCLWREARLAVELDGVQHALSTEQDASRTRYIEAGGYRVLRFTNREVGANLDGVLTAIAHALEEQLGVVPVAMTTLSAVNVRWVADPSTSTERVCGSRKHATPGISSMWLRISWDRMTSVSRPTTCWRRANRSEIVMSSLTR